jgi:TnpA family transposase
VRADSLNANYSFKYFGKGHGVSVYSFIDERNLLWYSVVISAAERESAYVIDGLMYNDVIKSDIHSTDSHGYTESIFGATYLLGFSYAPRIKNLKRQRLYIFKGRGKAQRSTWQINPAGYIDTKLIEENDLPDMREAMLKAIASGSVISWQHINLLGEYDFSEERLQDSFGIKLPKSMT